MLVWCKDRGGKVYELWGGGEYSKESNWIVIGDRCEVNKKVEEFIDSKGGGNGLGCLNESGIIGCGELGCYVDDVIEVDSFSNLGGSGECGKIYIVEDSNLSYRWWGSGYVEICKWLGLGESSCSGYGGDKGKGSRDKLNRIGDKVISDRVNVNECSSEGVLNFSSYREEG